MCGRTDMALLQSCCCWHSLRKGSYASALYTMAYFALTLLIMAVFLHEERQYLAGQEGNNTEPYEPVLETETITTSTMVFNVMVTVCSVLGLVSSALLVYGVYRDMKQLLVPWIAVVVMASIVDVAHVVYLIYIESKNFNPMTTIVFTLDFFLISFNIYSLLCVVSQYQEYRAGRGTAHQHRQFPAAAQVRYVSKPDLWPEGRGRTRGLSLVPTPTGPPNGPGLGTMGDHPPLTLVSPAHCSPSTCLLDAAQPQTHSPRSLSPGGAWPGGGPGGGQQPECLQDAGAGGGPGGGPGGGSFSRSPSVRKHVQFNQAVAEPGGGEPCGPCGLAPLAGLAREREGSFKGHLPGRRRSTIQRAPLPEESSLELQEGNSGDPEVEVVELFAPAPRAPPAGPPAPAPTPAPAPAPASHTATGAWLVPVPRPALAASSVQRVTYVSGGGGGGGNGLAT